MEQSSPPLADVRELSRLAYGFMASKVLFAALDLDLFGHLSARPQQPAELVQATGVPENRLSTLLSALRALGLITADAGGYTNSPAAQRFLVRTAPEYFGDYYRLQIDKQVFPTLLHLSDGIGGRPGPGIYELIQDPAEAELFSASQHQASTGPAVLLSRAVDFSRRRSLLDVAGGTGAFSIQLCRRYPDLRAMIIDFASVIEVARRFVDDAGLLDRIGLLAGNALEVEWPAAQDAVLMSYLLSAVSAQHVERLLDLARAALAPGGILLIHDFMLDHRRDGPSEAAVWFVTYLAHTQDAISFSDDEVADKLRVRGFSDIRSQPLIPGITKLVTAT